MVIIVFDNQRLAIASWYFCKIGMHPEEHAKRMARCVIQSNDLVAYVSEAGRVSAQT